MKSTDLCLIGVILISTIKLSKGSCKNQEQKVYCSSINEISDPVISEIPGINEVTSIKIDRNPQLRIFQKAFQSATNLQVINIRFNKINNIYPSTFENLPVKIINLGYNEINEVVPGAFSNLSNVEQIRINNNNLKAIPKKFLKNLPLKELVLSKNNISVIENYAFEEIPNLQKLKIDHNKLKFLFIHQIVSHPQKLEVIWLHNNSLTAVTNYMLQRLIKLKILNLGFNLISYIESNSFEQSPKLEYLVLTHNHLKEINGDIFPLHGMDYLEKLYLDNNKLMYLSSNFFVRTGSLKKITIVGNPWLCLCLAEVQKLLAQNNIQEKCHQEYTSGRRPICVSDTSATHCRYSYNEGLREKYETYKKNNPLIVSPLLCLL